MDTGLGTRQRRRNRRLRYTRWIVPSRTFLLFITRLGLGAGVLTAFVGMATWWHHANHVETLEILGVLDDPIAAREVQSFAQSVTALVVIVGVLSFLYIMILGAFLLHKIAGPLFRLRSHLMNVKNGKEWTPLSFRERDDLEDIADLLNEVMAKKP